MRHQLEMRFKAIEAFVNDASTRQIPEQIQSYLFRFGTVLICGNIERSIGIIILDRLADRAQPRVLTFVKSHFTRGTNFDARRLNNCWRALMRNGIAGFVHSWNQTPT
jgi:hypothetical protein